MFVMLCDVCDVQHSAAQQAAQQTGTTDCLVSGVATTAPIYLYGGVVLIWVVLK